MSGGLGPEDALSVYVSGHFYLYLRAKRRRSPSRGIVSPARNHAFSLCISFHTSSSRPTRALKGPPTAVHCDTTVRLIGSDTPEAEYTPPNPEAHCDPRPPPRDRVQ